MIVVDAQWPFVSHAVMRAVPGLASAGITIDLAKLPWAPVEALYDFDGCDELAGSNSSIEIPRNALK